MNLSYGHLHMPTLCSHAVMRIIRLASFMACRKSLPATMARCGRRSTTPLPHIGHGSLAFSDIATLRHRAPSRAWSNPVDMGGRAYVAGSATISLIDPFATAGGGGFVGCPYLLAALIPMGGRFGCFAIGPSTTFRIPRGGGFAETTACTYTESVLRSMMQKDVACGCGGFGIPAKRLQRASGLHRKSPASGEVG